MKGRAAIGVPSSFLDMTFGFVFVLLALVLISTVEEPKKAAVEALVPKAEFLVTLAWDDDSRDDIDLYLRSPDGVTTFFSHRQSAIAFLDSDNLGLGNTVSMPDGSFVTVPTRRETITIRAIAPGEYVVNAHFYKKNSPPGFVDHLQLAITKLNPFGEVTRASATFDTQGQEQTLANFTVRPDGSIGDVFLAPVKLVGNPG